MSKNAATLLTDGDDSARISPAGIGDASESGTPAGDSLSPLSLHTNANFRLLFSSQPHPMFVFDRDTLHYLDVNDAAIKNYGYSREEFLRMKVSDIRPAADIPRLMKILRQNSLAVSTLGVWKHRRKNGEIFDVEITSQGIGFGDHNAVLVSAVDITTRLAAERQIAEQIASLRAIMENNPIAIVVLDLEHRIRMCNPAFESTFQYRQAEITGQDLDTLLVPAGLKTEALTLSERASAGETVRANSRRRRSDGTLVDVQIIAVPLMVNGRCTGSFAMYEDITERNAAALARREAEERLRLLFENAVEGIFQASVDGRLLSVNPALARMCGYASPQEMIASGSDVARISMPTRRRGWNSCGAWKRTARSNASNISCDARTATRSGCRKMRAGARRGGASDRLRRHNGGHHRPEARRNGTAGELRNYSQRERHR